MHQGQGQAVWQLTKRAPASHTLIVWSHEPETIVLPSGEYATEVILLLWALSLVAMSSIVAARHAEESSALGFLVNRRGVCVDTCIPDFDRLVPRA